MRPMTWMWSVSDVNTYVGHVFAMDTWAFKSLSSCMDRRSQEPPKEDKYGLFDPSFALRANDSDSDSPRAAPPADLLDLDGPSPTPAAQGATAWADFGAPRAMAEAASGVAVRFRGPGARGLGRRAAGRWGAPARCIRGQV